ncbi:MAG: LysR substrate-binding domain-containing protein [Nocardioides sp.]
MPGLLGRFRSRHPQVQFRLSQSQDVLGSSLVVEGAVDLEFTARRPRNPVVHWERLLTQPLYLAVAPGHPLARQPSATLREVASEDFIGLRPTWELRHHSDALCRAAGFTAKVAFESDDLSTVTGLVAAGLGVAIVPAAPEHPEAALPGTAVPVPLTDPGATRDIGLAWSRERRLLPSARLFRAQVLTEFAGTPPDA